MWGDMVENNKLDKHIMIATWGWSTRQVGVINGFDRSSAGDGG
jgi:hypothetical protein